MHKEIEWFLKNQNLLKEVYGSKWVVVHNQTAHGGFDEAIDALAFRSEKWPDSKINVLIRHTEHVERVLMVPSVFTGTTGIDERSEG